MLRRFGFLRTTALGGVLFLLPLIVLGALIGQAVPIVAAVARFIGKIIPVQGAVGVSIVIALAVALCMLICFGAGMVARLSLGRRLSGWMEHHLTLLFPRYIMVRDQMAGKVGAGLIESSLKPVLVSFDDHQVLAFESERTAERVVIFLPGAPDPWSGQIVFVEPRQVAPLSMEFGRAIELCKRMGHGAAAEIGQARTAAPAVQPVAADELPRTK